MIKSLYHDSLESIEGMEQISATNLTHEPFWLIEPVFCRLLSPGVVMSAPVYPW